MRHRLPSKAKNPAQIYAAPRKSATDRLDEAALAHEAKHGEPMTPGVILRQAASEISDRYGIDTPGDSDPVYESVLWAATKLGGVTPEDEENMQ